MVEITAGDRRIVLGDGANLRYYDDLNKVPPKHQLLIEFIRWENHALFAALKYKKPPTLAAQFIGVRAVSH